MSLSSDTMQGAAKKAWDVQGGVWVLPAAPPKRRVRPGTCSFGFQTSKEEEKFLPILKVHHSKETLRAKLKI